MLWRAFCHVNNLRSPVTFVCVFGRYQLYVPTLTAVDVIRLISLLFFINKVENILFLGKQEKRNKEITYNCTSLLLSVKS